MIILFVDANLFLQCKNITELEWEDLFPNQQLKILIPRAVQKEIDNFKGQGNTRRSKRAKLASAYFKEILKSTDSLVITNNTCISFPSRKELSKVEPESGLDSNKNDDSIIQDILSYQKLHLNEAVSLLTNDSNLMVTAKEYGISFNDIPESWFLEPEPDDKDKKISDLEKRIRAFETNFPVIKIHARTINEDNISSIEITLMEYPELSNIEIDKLLNLIKQKNPMTVNFDNNPKSSSIYLSSEIQLVTRSRYSPPAETTIRNYTDNLYPQWAEKVRESLKVINTHIFLKKNISDADIIITNNGQVPAEGVLFEISLTEHFLLYSDEEKNILTRAWKLPDPPEAPNWKISTFNNPLSSLTNSLLTPRFEAPRIDHFSQINFPNSRDKNSFYWKNTPPTLSQTWVRECEEFRHQMQPEEITVKIIPKMGQRPTGGKITCSVSARNLPNPVTFSVNLKVTHKVGNTYDEALKLLGY
jgi:rRNA-processing protein FCF1